MGVRQRNSTNKKAFYFFFVILISALALALFFTSSQQNTDNRSRASGITQEKSVFSDISATYQSHVPAINYLYRAGIAAGCGTNPLRFCPERPITRSEAAVFLLRAKYGGKYAPPAPQGIFTDVPTTNPLAGFIEQMYKEGITAGCSVTPLKYCPNDPLTREMAATLLVRAKQGSSFAPPQMRGYFADVDAANPFGKYIEQLMDSGYTAGCAKNPLRFCPKQNISRADMAIFIYKAFALETPFSDVSKTYWAAPQIARIYKAGITSGCGTNPLRFCPDKPATRAEVVAFILKGKYNTAFARTGSRIFTDVPETHQFVGYIEKAYEDGLTSGCGTNPLRFCPDKPATRAETARLFINLKYGKNFTPPAYKGTFSDVPQSHPHAQMIEQFEKDAHTVGCDSTPRKYCPDRPVTRAEMAVFLSSVFEL